MVARIAITAKIAIIEKQRCIVGTYGAICEKKHDFKAHRDTKEHERGPLRWQRRVEG